MWRSYLIVGLRALIGNRFYTLINMAGLAIGIAAAVLIFLYVRYETSYDRWLPDAGRIYQLQTRFKVMGPEPVDNALAPRAAVDAMRREFPAIEKIVALTSAAAITRVGDQPRSTPLLLVDPDFFDLFDLRFVRGDRRTALGDMASLVLTEREARGYFGEADPIGRTVEVETGGRTRTLRVTGVLADLPANTHLDLRLIARFNPAEADPGYLGNWGAIDSFVYARLRPGAEIGEINARMPAFEKRNLGPFDQGFDYRFAPILGSHLAPPLEGAMKPGGDPLAVRAFAAIAALILLIACFNFTNLATARASQRAREVGLRKALGARRGQLIAQFMAESMLLAAIGTLLGLVLVELLLPFFNRLLEIQLSLAYFGGDSIFLPALALALLVGTVSGLYPAVYLSRFQPARVLRTAAVAGGSGPGWLRNLLVAGQFAIAIGLMICAALVYTQTLFARQADPGFQPRRLLVVENLSMPEVKPVAATLRDRIAALPGVAGASLSGNSPTGDRRTIASARRPEMREPLTVDIVSVDYGLLATMGIRLVAGRGLSERVGGDSLPRGAGASAPGRARFNILVNQTAVARLGFAAPQAALGQELVMPAGRGTIVGIVGDVRYGSLRQPAPAAVYLRDEADFNYLVVRYASGDPAALVGAVHALWRGTAAGRPFAAKFVEDVLAAQYRADAVRGQVFAIAAALAVAIACLGLFGLAALTVERRKLEIAVRKVFGASDRDIVRLMVWQFSRPVLAANLAAWPAAWWLMRGWLNQFPERIALHPGWFLAAGALALAVAIVTVSGHALSVSRTSPARVLRSE
jgi:putative ABC transport system permease protein